MVLDIHREIWYNCRLFETVPLGLAIANFAPVAQLDRALVYGTKG